MTTNGWSGLTEDRNGRKILGEHSTAYTDVTDTTDRGETSDK